ncbi:MAG: hypothetical protein SFU25_05770 [Candidatus Caenarcaniphilales bacterium]|nr:hypothetical protein [Candidatus Caenarcaniphilales bacterium]
MVTKNPKSSKAAIKKIQEFSLTVSEYAKHFGITDQTVRARLKKGELQASEIIKNGRKVLAIKVNEEIPSLKSAPKASDIEQEKQGDKKSPKLIKVGSLKPANFQDLIQEKDDEIKKLKSELRSSYDQSEKLDKEVKRLNEIIKSKSELIQTHEKSLKAKDQEIQGLKNASGNSPSAPKEQKVDSKVQAKQSVKIPFNPPSKQEPKKETGFFAKLFGKK